MREQTYVRSTALGDGIVLEERGYVLADLHLVRECQTTYIAKPKGTAITKSFQRLRRRRADAAHTRALDAKLASVSTKKKYRLRAAAKQHARERLTEASKWQILPCGADLSPCEPVLLPV